MDVPLNDSEALTGDRFVSELALALDGDVLDDGGDVEYAYRAALTVD